MKQYVKEISPLFIVQERGSERKGGEKEKRKKKKIREKKTKKENRKVKGELCLIFEVLV